MQDTMDESLPDWGLERAEELRQQLRDQQHAAVTLLVEDQTIRHGAGFNLYLVAVYYLCILDIFKSRIYKNPKFTPVLEFLNNLRGLGSE